MKLLITGAAGAIGQLLSRELSKRYQLRLADILIFDCEYCHDLIRIDITRPETLTMAMKDIDCVLHLAAISGEIDDWRQTFNTNILGTANVFEAASKAGVKRVIYASSIHAVGFYSRQQIINRWSPPRPSSFYGVSKVAGEAIASLFADKFDLSCICLRINSFIKEPQDKRHLQTWLSEADTVRLFDAAINAPDDIHFEIIYGISANSQAKANNEGTTLNYQPQDNAEYFLQQIIEKDIAEGPISMHFHGGCFCEQDYQGNLEKTLTKRLRKTHQ